MVGLEACNKLSGNKLESQRVGPPHSTPTSSRTAPWPCSASAWSFAASTPRPSRGRAVPPSTSWYTVRLEVRLDGPVARAGRAAGQGAGGERRGQEEADWTGGAGGDGGGKKKGAGKKGRRKYCGSE